MAIRHAKGSPPGKRPSPFKRIVAAAAGATMVLALSGGMSVASAQSAEAHVPRIGTTCKALTLDLQDYRYQAAVPAQGYTEYEWTKTTVDTKTSINSPGSGWVQGNAVAWQYVDKHGNTRWEDSATWNAQSNPQSFGWKLSGQIKHQWTKTTTQTEWAKDSPGKGWTKTGQSRFHETAPAQPEKTNSVVVTIDNTQVANTTFATSFNHVYNYDSKYVNHTYTVAVKAWDDPTGSYGWTKTFTGASTACQQPFNWNWQYPAPTCTDGLVVTYPGNIPAGQANDVNIKVKNLITNQEKTFNFHDNTGTWSGTQTFNVTTRPDWPGWTYYAYEWTQVAGTNYHWTGTVTCGDQPPVEDASASVIIRQPTCTADGIPSSGPITHATWTSAVLDGNTWVYTAVADKGHAFPGGAPTEVFREPILPEIPGQSTDPSSPCYVPPTPPPTTVTLVNPITVDQCGVSNDSLTGVPTKGVRYEGDGHANLDGSFTINEYAYPEVVDGVTYVINTKGMPSWKDIPGKYAGWYLNDGGVPTFTVITQNQPCGTQPPDKVVVTEGTPVCGVDTVDVSTATTPSVWNPVTSTWDLGTTTVVKSTRAVTNQEKAALHCSSTPTSPPTTAPPSPTPNPSSSTPVATPSPTSTTPVVASSHTTPKSTATLAYTGSNDTPLLRLALLALLLGGVLVAARAIIRRRQGKRA